MLLTFTFARLLIISAHFKVLATKKEVYAGLMNVFTLLMQAHTTLKFSFNITTQRVVVIEFRHIHE